MPGVTQLIVTRSGTQARQPDNNTGDLNHVSVLGKKCLWPQKQRSVMPGYRHMSRFLNKAIPQRQKDGAPTVLSNPGRASEPPGKLLLTMHNRFQLIYFLSVLMQSNINKRTTTTTTSDSYSCARFHLQWLSTCDVPGTLPCWALSTERSRHGPGLGEHPSLLHRMT